MIITATTSATSARLRVTLTTAEAAKRVQIRIADGNSVRWVRGWGAPSTGRTLLVVVDHEVPINRPVTYQVLLDGVIAGQTTVTIPTMVPLLGDPVRGQTIRVTIMRWNEHVHDRAQSMLWVAGRPDPIILDDVERCASSALVLLHNLDPASAADLEQVISTSSTLCLRTPDVRVGDAWLSIKPGRKRRRFSAAPASVWVDECEAQMVAQPAPSTVAVGSTLGDLARTVPTALSTIATRWQFLADIALEDMTA